MIPYKGNLLERLLEQFDVVTVATYTIRSSIERCSDPLEIQALLRRMIPGTLAEQARHLSSVACAALAQTTVLQTWSLGDTIAARTRESPTGSPPGSGPGTPSGCPSLLPWKSMENVWQNVSSASLAYFR